MRPAVRRTSFTAPLLALALAAASAGCATVSRPVEAAQVQEDPQSLVGRSVRFVDASDRVRELRVVSIDHPVLRGTSRSLGGGGAGRYVERAPVTEEVDLRTVRELVVLEPGDGLSEEGALALGLAEAVLRGVVMAGLGLLIVVL